MRIWFVSVTELDDRHLLGEHLELHVMASVLIRGGGGWYNHPATKMFRGKLGALYRRHEEQVAEMARRGFTGHKTPFPVDMIPPNEMDTAIEITEEMLAKDREDLAERIRLTEERGGMSWRKAKIDRGREPVLEKSLLTVAHTGACPSTSMCDRAWFLASRQRSTSSTE